MVTLPVDAMPTKPGQLDTDDLLILPRMMFQDHFIWLVSGLSSYKFYFNVSNRAIRNPLVNGKILVPVAFII